MAEGKLEEYLAKAQTVYEEGIKLIQDMTGWDKLDYESEKVTCSKRFVEETSFATLKADMFYDKAPETVAKYMFNNWGDLNLELNPDDLEEYRRTATLNDEVHLWYAKSKKIGPIDPRDFAICSVYLNLGNDTFAIVQNSVDSDIPVPEGTTRADCKIFVHLLEPASGDSARTHYSGVFLVDPKGSVPSFVANGVMGRRAAFYEKLQEKIAAMA